LTIELTRQDVALTLERLDLDWGDEDDAKCLLDLLLERYTPTQAMTWLCWRSEELGETPLSALSKGAARDVFRVARGMVAG
jgi:hypothetical protein